MQPDFENQGEARRKDVFAVDRPTSWVDTTDYNKILDIHDGYLQEDQT